MNHHESEHTKAMAHELQGPTQQLITHHKQRPEQEREKLFNLIAISASVEDSPLVGSSRKQMKGLVESPRARVRRLFWPPEMPRIVAVPMMLSITCSIPKSPSRVFKFCSMSFCAYTHTHESSAGRCVQSMCGVDSRHEWNRESQSSK